MSGLAYYLFSLVTVLSVAAIVSALVTGQLRRAQRQFQAFALLDALARSSEWVAAQARAVRFQAATRTTDAALDEVRSLQREWFPELGALADQLVAVHRRMAELLRLHERLRADDPEAWLDGAYDAAFIASWRDHRAIAQAMEARLMALVAPAGAMQQHGFPA